MNFTKASAQPTVFEKFSKSKPKNNKGKQKEVEEEAKIDKEKQKEIVREKVDKANDPGNLFGIY